MERFVCILDSENPFYEEPEPKAFYHPTPQKELSQAEKQVQGQGNQTQSLIDDSCSWKKVVMLLLFLFSVFFLSALLTIKSFRVCKTDNVGVNQKSEHKLKCYYG